MARGLDDTCLHRPEVHQRQGFRQRQMAAIEKAVFRHGLFASATGTAQHVSRCRTFFLDLRHSATTWLAVSSATDEAMLLKIFQDFLVTSSYDASEVEDTHFTELNEIESL